MSRLLILATGSYGDYAPYAGLWRALKQYRHQVALAGIARSRTWPRRPTTPTCWRRARVSGWVIMLEATDRTGSGCRRPAALAAAVVWLLGPAQFLVVHLVVQSRWPTPYSWAANNVSDLGNVGCRDWDGRPVCSPWHDAMNISFVVTEILFVVGIGLLCVAVRRGPRVAHWLLGLAAASWALAGVAPADVDENLHLLAAVGILVVGNLGLVVLVGSRTDAFPGRTAAWSAVVLGVLGLTAAAGGMERVAAFGLPDWTWIAAAAMITLASDHPQHAKDAGPDPLAGRQ